MEGGLTYTQTFDAENRLVSVTVNSQTTQFIYDGDGNLVKKIKPDGSKTIYVGSVYEVDKTSGGSVTRTITYYPAAGAMRIDSTLYYTLKDHLGSASVVTDATGTVVGEERYYPFGETRLMTGSMYTDKLYTGQREMGGLGIYHYNARFYSPTLGRFLSADTIVPGAANPQAYNRYSYVLNNPIRYNDPTGHVCSDPDAPRSRCDGSGGRPSNPSANTPLRDSPVYAPAPRDPEPNPIPGGGWRELPVAADTGSAGGTVIEETSPEEPSFIESIQSYWYVLYDLIYDPLIAAGNIGIPVYKQAKGFIPYGALGESVVGASFQLLEDLDTRNLSMSQRLGRALVVGAENGLTDLASSGLGTAAGLLTGVVLLGDFVPLDEVPGGGFVFFATMVTTNIAMTEYFDRHNDALFSELGLSDR